MQRVIITALLFLFSTSPTMADVCHGESWVAALKTFHNQKNDDEERGAAGACLVRFHLSRPEVAAEIIKVLKNADEALFVREDIVEALSNTPFRRTIAIRESISTGPITTGDKAAVSGRTVANVSALLDGNESMRTTKEVLPVTQKEVEIVRALGDIVTDDQNHILFRAAAVTALSNIAKNMRESGVYTDSTLHLAYESMRYASMMPGEATYFVGSGKAYARVAEVHNEILAAHQKTTRGLASEPMKR